MVTDQPNKGVQLLDIDDQHAGQRVDNFLMARCRRVPKAHIYKILRKGEVRVNKKRVKPEYRLQSGDMVRIPPIRLPQQQLAHPSENLQQVIAQSVIYEDDFLIVINKPVNVAVHGGTTVSAGVIDTLRAIRPQQRFLELVHRLDKATSGCLLVAKKRAMLLELQSLFKLGKVNKRYTALTKGHWPADECIVDVPLKKQQLASGERMVKVASDGKPSKTKFRVLQRFVQADLVEAVLYTGRTHQIRVHAQSKSHPLAGDSRYGDEAFNQIMKENYSLHRLFLHASKLAFKLPSLDKYYEFSAPLDHQLLRCLTKLEKQQ